jgi:hypothetical protein
MKSATNITRKPNKSVADAEVPLFAGLLEVGLGRFEVEDMEVIRGRSIGEKRRI